MGIHSISGNLMRLTIEKLVIDGKANLCYVDRKMGYSRSWWGQQFVQQVGMRPKVYNMRFRVRYICHLLTTTHLRVRDICLDVGSTDTYICRMFKDVMGLTMVDFRLLGSLDREELIREKLGDDFIHDFNFCPPQIKAAFNG